MGKDRSNCASAFSGEELLKSLLDAELLKPDDKAKDHWEPLILTALLVAGGAALIVVVGFVMSLLERWLGVSGLWRLNINPNALLHLWFW